MTGAKNTKKGFTLVELIVVITIIGVLAAIVVPTTVHFVEQAKVEKAEAEVRTIINNLYVNIPNIESGSVAGQSDDSINSASISLVLNKYIGKVEEGTTVSGALLEVDIGGSTVQIMRFTAQSPVSNDDGPISFSKDYYRNAGVLYVPFQVSYTSSSGWH